MSDEASAPVDPTRRDAVTQWLHALSEGVPGAFDGLAPLVYDELHALAHEKLRFERSDHTLATTDLVHEAYLRLVDQKRVRWESRAHFFAIAAQAMRRILVNHAAKRNAQKRGGHSAHVPIDQALDRAAIFDDEQAIELLALDSALTRLERVDARSSRVVEYRFFGGMTYEEVADVLGCSPVTVRRAWTIGKTWLRRELETSA